MAFLSNAGLERLWAHIISKLNTKIDKVEGKGLSTEDYTTEEKEKLAAMQEDIDQLAGEVAEKGNVKTVNGTSPDSQGNVSLTPELPSPKDIADDDQLFAILYGKVLSVGLDEETWELVDPQWDEQVRCTSQVLNTNQQAQARTNIGAASVEELVQLSEHIGTIESSVEGLSEEIAELKGGDLTAIGATPLRVERDTPGVVLRSDGECAYTIKSDTVTNTDAMTFVEKNSKLTNNGIYELKPDASVTTWSNGYATVYISGLTIGEAYNLVIDCRNVGLNTANYIGGGYYRLFKGTASGETEKQFAVTQEGLSVTNFVAVAETQWLRIWAYDGIKYDVTKSTARFRDIYVNRADGGTEKSEIINMNGTFNGEINIGDLPAYVTVDSNPACTVYKAAEDADALDDMLREYGMSHYTYKDDVLTVYQNGTKTVYGYHGNNNIMMCKGYGLVDAFVSFKTDILSPMIITASENADGDLEDTYRLTGGNHSYAQTSGTPSANTVLVEVFADGKPAGASGLFNALTLHARHEVQAWNTEKADGTGRAVLIEDDYITWDGERMNVEIHLTPTENVVISEYYGLQLAEINSCNVYGSKVKKNIATGGYSDEVPYFIEGICNGFRIRMHLEDVGLGDYTYNETAIKYSKNDYKKAYFRPIGESHSFAAEDCLWLRGYFEILPPANMGD